MSTTQTTVDYILDQIGLDRVTSRKMFGEYALYCDGKVVALICDNTLFVKITAPGQKFVGHDYQEGQPYPSAKPAMKISLEKIEDSEWLSELITLTASALPAAKSKKPRS